MYSYYKPETMNGNKVIDPKWVDGEAQDAAKSFFGYSEKDAIKSSQLRRFYSDIKALERQWVTCGADQPAFEVVVLPMLKLLKAKSAYAWKRKVVPESFKKWLWEHVDSVKTSDDFKVFLLHFEAVVGFSYGHAHGNFA